MKGCTRWYPRHIKPVRNGWYECFVRIAGGAYVRWRLWWDGVGFLVPIPMVVLKWRGQTKKAAQGSGGNG